MDAYCKLEHWGIQIYAAIDVYSRYLVWIYIGITARTAWSVYAQYIATATSGAVIPMIIRSDRGAETVAAADAHYYLSSQLREQPEEQPLGFSDCFRFGTSKKNQRIEAWWNQQSFSTTARWRDYFEELSEQREWIKDNLADRIALLAVYVPIIRTELLEFCELYNNSSRIRKQKNRPHVVPGIPTILYHYPQLNDGHHCGISVPREALQEAHQELEGFGNVQYPPNICDNRLTSG